MDRESLLVEEPKVREKDNKLYLPFITAYLYQHYKVKESVRRHWHVLKNYNILGDTLPEQPQVMFRGVSSLRDIVAPNVCDPSNTKLMFFQNMVGIYKCKGCPVCCINSISNKKTTQFTSHNTSKGYSM